MLNATLKGKVLGPDATGDYAFHFEDQKRGDRQIPISAISPCLVVEGIAIQAPPSSQAAAPSATAAAASPETPPAPSDTTRPDVPPVGEVPGAVGPTKEQVVTALRKALDDAGVKYHPNTGEEKLRDLAKLHKLEVKVAA